MAVGGGLDAELWARRKEDGLHGAGLCIPLDVLPWPGRSAGISLICSGAALEGLQRPKRANVQGRRESV